MDNPIKTFEPNTVGRDFVIGDLHGSWSCFENLLKNLNFDKTKDRMFSVGDLVDRGPDSLKCLELIYEPWFHCTLSNHEQMMLEAFEGGWMGNFWLRNGGMWGATAVGLYREHKRTFYTELDRPRQPTDDEARIWDLVKKVKELPFLITVKMKDGKKFHIIHAELPPGQLITDDDLANPDRVKELACVQSHDGDFILWGRHMFMRFYRADLSNVEKVKRTIAYDFRNGSIFNDKLSHVISGHTIVQRPLTILGQTNIDTCAYDNYFSDGSRWAALTCIELGGWSFYQATPTEFRTVEPVTVNRADIDPLIEKAFGNGQATPGSGS